MSPAKNENQDEGLKGNEKIEDAIAALQSNATEELLAHTLTVIRRRMKEGGQLIVAVEPSVQGTQMNLQTVKTTDGAVWWSAFTSFEEELKGADQIKSTFLTDIDKLFQTALSVPEIKGVILNPWNRTIMLDKHLIEIIMPKG
ncbi:SseB family protein [Roseburia sp. BX1005]|uniref:SseB family protein n=1 Tax=Roseburia zhanii TaxID=2763064 RepID=A0A923RT15_9FIRM|nr:SseB family protein [Roseburia zhanii]MBC5714246.1 SseB family protein [Roseburia zhanii]